jgi:signal transduction histidine kinase
MNHDVERSSHAVIEDGCTAGGPEPRRERERVAQEMVEELRGRSALPGNHSGQMPTVSLSRRALGRLLDLAGRVICEGRSVLQGLRSPLRPPTGLEKALSALLDEIAPSASPRLRILVTGRPKTLRSAVEKQIYLIGREALMNALRHSEATSIEAEVEYSPRRLRVVVRDNGCGIEPKLLTSERHPNSGLCGMLQQARGMGARLQIWSRPGTGTEVELSLPFDSQTLPG